MQDVVAYISMTINGILIPWLILIERRLSRIEGFLKAVLEYNNK